MRNIDQILHQVIVVMKEAGQMTDKKQDFVVSKKSKGNYVTSIDISVENFLKKELAKILPQTGIIAEESSPVTKDINWVIDPIDGTGNMLSGFPYASAVALMKEETVLLGVVISYADQTIYAATKDGGACVWRNSSEIPQPLKVQTQPSDEGIVIFGVPYDRSKTHRIFSIAERLYPCCSDIKRIGPSALDICCVAEGRAKLYVEFDLNPWDYLAAKLILEEAGGCHRKQGAFHLFASNQEQAAEALHLLDGLI